jgi:hypothetical protein
MIDAPVQTKRCQRKAKSLKIEAATGLTNKLSRANPVITFTSVIFIIERTGYMFRTGLRM